MVRLVLLLPVICLAACSGSGSGPVAPRANEDIVAGDRVKSGELFDDDYKKIQNKFGAINPNLKKDGQFVTGSGREVSEFKRDNPEFKGRWEGKDYKTGDYRKKSWWGDKDYVKKVYGGDTDANDLRKDSRFNGSAAGEGEMAARDTGKTYGTKAYATKQARENGGSELDRPSDAETDERRRVFTDPDIIPWQQQNGVTLDDTKRALGR